MRDDVSEFDSRIVGKMARLDIPLQSVVNLRRVAEELRGLAYQLECLSKYPADTPTTTMLEVRNCIRRTNRNIEQIRGRGRPKIGRQFQKTNKM